MSNTVNATWIKQPIAGGSSNEYVYQCTMEWNQPSDDSNHTEIISPKFIWKVDSDFVVFVNYKAVDTSTSADVVMHIYGSIDNTNKIDMVTAQTITNANFDGKIYKYLYDVSTNGIAPVMYVSLDPSADLGAVDIDVAVFPNARRPD